MTHPIFRYGRKDATGTITKDNLVREIYDLADPETGVEVSGLLTQARDAFDEANPGLTFPLDVTEFVSTPVLEDIPFRVPRDWNDPSQDDEDIPSNVVRGWFADPPTGRPVRRAITLAFSALKTTCQYVGQWNPAIDNDVLRIKRIIDMCDLMALPSVNPYVAHLLVGAGSDPDVPALDRVAQLTVDELRTLLNNPDNAPEAWRDTQPWNQIHRAVQRFAKRRSKVPNRPTAVPVSVGTVESQVARWASVSSEPRTMVAEFHGARALEAVARLQATLLRANDHLNRGRPSDAVDSYQQLIRQLVSLAKDLAFVEPTADEEDGLSVNSVTKVCGILLDYLVPEQVEQYKSALGYPQDGPRETLRGFSLVDVIDARAASVEEGPIANLADFGDEFSNAIRLQLGELGRGTEDIDNLSIFSNLGTSLLDEQNTDSAFRDMNQNAFDRLNQNTRRQLPAAAHVTFKSLDGSGSSPSPRWRNYIRPKAKLHRVRAKAVGTWSGSIEDWYISAAATPARKAALGFDPSVGPFEEVTVFDRYLEIQPLGPANSPPPIFIPVTADYDLFVTNYVATVLPRLTGDAEPEWTNLRSEDFADPARFLARLPALYASQVPMAISMAYTAVGDNRRAGAFQGARYLGDTAILSVPLGFNLAVAFLGAEFFDVNAMTDQEFLDRIISWNDQGDRLYKDNRLHRARRAYEVVEDWCSRKTSLLTFPQDLDLALIHVRTQIGERRTSGAELQSISLLNLITDDDEETPTQSWPVVSGTYPVRQSNMFTPATGAFGNGELPEYQARAVRIAPKDSALSALGAHLGGLESDGVFRVGSGFLQSRQTTTRASANRMAVPIYVEPVDPKAIEAQLIRAKVMLSQLASGLNWLGFDPNVVPVWRFDYLVQQARYFIEKSDSLQQRTMNFILQAESRDLTIATAEMQAKVAAEGVDVANAQRQLAAAQTESAVQAENQAIEMAQASSDATIVNLFGSFASTIGALATGNVAGAVSTMASGISNAMQAGAESENAMSAAQQQVLVAEAQEQVAVAQTDLAILQASQAEAYLGLLGQSAFGSDLYRTLAGHTAKLGKGYLMMGNRMAYLAEKSFQWETRTDSRVIQMSYEDPKSAQGEWLGAATLLSHLDSLVHQRVTGIAQRFQLLKVTWSLRDRDPAALMYLQANGTTRISLPQKALDIMFPGLYLHNLRRLEVEFDGILPPGGIKATVSVSGIGKVRVPNRPVFLANFPRSAFSEDWTYPFSEYSLDSGTPPPAPFVMKPIKSNPVSQMLSEYRRAQDSVTLSAPEGALDAFENLPLDTIWTLTLPPGANDLDRDGIADVRFVLYFQALHDGALAHHQQARLLEGGPTGNTLGARIYASTLGENRLTALVEGPDNFRKVDHRRVLVPVGPQALHNGLTKRKLKNVTGTILGLDAVEPSITLRADLRIAHRLRPFGVRLATATYAIPAHGEAQYGNFYSGVGDVEQRMNRINGDGSTTLDVLMRSDRRGDFQALHDMVDAIIDAHDGALPDDPSDDDNEETALGDWLIKWIRFTQADGTTTVNRYRRDEEGDNITVAGGYLNLPNTATAAVTGASWKHIEARVTLSGTSGNLWPAGTLTMTLRSGSTPVTAKVTTADAGSGNTSITLEIAGPGGPPLMTDFVTGTIPTSELDPYTEWVVRVYDQHMEVQWDGLTVLSKGWTGTTPAAGGLTFGFSGASNQARIYDLTVRRLDFEGNARETLIDDNIADASAFTLASGATRVAATHTLNDLRIITDVALQVDYDGTPRVQS